MPTKYVQELNLSSYNVFHQCDPLKSEFFDIQGVMGKTFGYGKHLFSISMQNPKSNPGLYFKYQSNILFEVLDYKGNVINSGLTNIKHVDGASYAWFHIVQELDRTYEDISDGPAKLIILGELDGPNLPQKWKNSYNIKKEIPFYIRKNNPNTSQILFKANPVARVSQSTGIHGPGQSWDKMYSYADYHTHEFDKLATFSGEVKYVDILYQFSSSFQETNQYSYLDSVEISSSVELLTNNISKSSGIPEPNVHDEKIGVFDHVQKKEYWTYATMPLRSSTINTSNATFNLAGDNAVHKLVRYATEDENFTIKINYSGSGAYSIIRAKNSHSLSEPTNKALISGQLDAGVETVYKKKFVKFKPETRTGPYIDESVKPELTGNYDLKSFHIPSGSWFAIRLESYSSIGQSGSFWNISIKENPGLGVNPDTFYYKTKTPIFDYHNDHIFYKYRFRNVNYDLAKNYKKIPIEDVTSHSDIATEQQRRVFHRRNGQIAHRFRSTVTDGTGNGEFPRNSVAILGEAAGSGSSEIEDNVFLSPNQMTIGVMGQAGAGNSGSEVATAVGIYGVGRVYDQSATSSVYSAIFDGHTNAGDVLALQKLGVGNFNYINDEHPDTTLHVKGDISASGNMHIDGKLTAEEYHTYITSASIIFSSGSTLFGNTADDTHVFTGSMFITGSGSPHTGGYISASGDVHFGKNLYLGSSNQNETIIYFRKNPYITFNEYSELLAIGDATGNHRTNALISTAGGYFAMFTGSLADKPSIYVTGSVGPSTAGGNVGIRTYNPTKELTVQGSISASGDVYLREGKFLQWKDQFTKIIHTGTPQAGDLLFYSSVGEIPLALSQSNVGMGTATPPEKLTVAGNISSSGNINLDGGINAVSGSNIITSGSITMTTGISGSGESITLNSATGNISASGLYLGTQIQHTFHQYNNDSNANGQYIPAPGGYIVEGTTINYYRRWIAPYDGRLRQCIVRAENDPGDGNRILFYVNGSFSTRKSRADGAPGADTAQKFDMYLHDTALIGTPGSPFNAGDKLSVRYDPVNTPGDVNIVCTWEFDINS